MDQNKFFKMFLAMGEMTLNGVSMNINTDSE